MNILQPYLDSAKGILLKADNDKYLSVESNYLEHVEASRDAWCPFCVFYITKIDSNTIALHTKGPYNQKKYLSRVWSDWVNHITGSKTEIDEYCMFKVIVNGGKLVLRADNGKLLSRIERNGRQKIEADKFQDFFDESTKFRIVSEGNLTFFPNQIYFSFCLCSNKLSHKIKLLINQKYSYHSRRHGTFKLG